MNFLDGSLFPENQQKLVITAAPYGPEWMPSDFPEDIPVSMEEHIQKAVDCYNAGATVLHMHVREDDGKGSKRLSKFNELLAGIRARVPEMILQVGGSISFAPEGEGDVGQVAVRRHPPHAGRADADAGPGHDRHQHQPDERRRADVRGRPRRHLAGRRRQCYRAYREMTIPAGPEWVEEHIRRLSANGIQTHFQLANIAQLRRSSA